MTLVSSRDRAIWTTLHRSSPHLAKRLPRELQNRVVFKSPNSKIGRIIVRRWSGVDKNYTAKALRTFVKNVGETNEGIAATISLSPTVTKGMRRLADALADPKNGNKSLAYVVAMSGADASEVIEHYARGAVHVKKWESVAMAAQDMPRMVRELIRVALPKKALCRTCIGAGKITVRRGRKPAEVETCLTCDGVGWVGTMDKEAQFAIDKLAEISTLVEKKGPLVAIQNNNTAVVDGTRLMEKIVGLSDHEEMVEAEEVVEVPLLPKGEGE